MSDIGFGLWMALLGMGSVFILLFALMGLLRLIGWLDGGGWHRLVARRAVEPEPEPVPAEPELVAGLSPAEAAAVAVAVAAYVDGGSVAVPPLPLRGEGVVPWVVTTRGRQHDHYPRRK